MVYDFRIDEQWHIEAFGAAIEIGSEFALAATDFAMNVAALTRPNSSAARSAGALNRSSIPPLELRRGPFHSSDKTRLQSKPTVLGGDGSGGECSGSGGRDLGDRSPRNDLVQSIERDELGPREQRPPVKMDGGLCSVGFHYNQITSHIRADPHHHESNWASDNLRRPSPAQPVNQTPVHFGARPILNARSLFSFLGAIAATSHK